MPFHWLPKLECFVGVAKKAAKNRYIQVAAATLLTGIVVSKARKVRAKRAFLKEIAEQPKGVVYLYAPHRAIAGSPHFSWNVTKIEAFCRVHKIDYEFRFMDPFTIMTYSPTESIPFVAVNGKLVGESQFCVDAIAHEFLIDIEKGRPTASIALELLIRRMLDNVTALELMDRNFIVENPTVARDLFANTVAPTWGIPAIVMKMMFSGYRSKVCDKLNGVGLGWHTTERYQIELLRDLRAVSAIIEKSQSKGFKYLFGNIPCVADCLLYGHLATWLHLPMVTNDTKAFEFLHSSKPLNKFHDDFKADYFEDLETICPSKLELPKQTFSFAKKKTSPSSSINRANTDGALN